ncbi:MAG: NDP-sugar synthase [Thermodesulfobacteriota bacterium]|nr:NDP-sugar synthase [Thermodesulfobacteriota bacterium]
MKAMILAAGLGTRLRPLTLNRPKTLVPVCNTPVIDRTLKYLKAYGVSQVVVNAHHHHEKVVEHFNAGRLFGLEIEIRVEREIMGTGGGIKNTEDFWDPDPFIVINGDILTDIDLTSVIDAHKKNGALATMTLHDFEPFNQIQIDDRLNILDIAAETHPLRLGFTGIHIIEPELLSLIPEGVYSNIVDCYRRLIGLGGPIKAYVSNGHYWRDMGTIGSYVLANKEALRETSFLLGPECDVHDSAILRDWAIIGEQVCLEEGVEISRSILWEGVKVKKGVRVMDSIVTSSKIVECDLIDRVL